MVMQGSGGELNGAMRSAIAGIGPGSRVIFDNIVAVGPDGTSRSLDGIILSAN